MRRILSMTISCILVLLLSGCTKTMVDNRTEHYMIDFNTSPTRVAVEENFTEGSAFSVWGNFNGTANYGKVDIFDGDLVSLNNGKWTYEGTQYWIDGKTYNFSALYPDRETLNTENIMVQQTENGFDITDFNVENGHDLMTAFSTVDYDKASGINTVSLYFKHHLSRVDFVVKRGASWDDNMILEVVSAKLYGMSYKGNCTMSDKSQFSWSNLMKADEVSTPFYVNGLQLGKDTPSSVLFPSSERADGSIMFIPQSINEEVILKIEYKEKNDNSTKTKEVAISDRTTAWESGRHYVYTLVINPDGIIFDGLQADNWGETSSGGNIPIK